MIREHGWTVYPGNLQDAQALEGIFLRAGSALPPELQPPGKMVVLPPPAAPVATPPIPPAPLTPEHLLGGNGPDLNPGPMVWHAPEGQRAAFLIATHRRPVLLEACLRHLSMQEIPEGWQVETLVAGEAGDPGARVVQSFANTRFIEVPSWKVTDKLNHLAQVTTADLLLLADDDDLQAPNRLKAAVQALGEGCPWSASGLHRFVDLTTGAVARWEGPAVLGLVGTTMSIRRELFLQVGGYPSVAQDKDGHLAYRIKNQAPDSRFRDVSRLIGADTICLQHGANIQQGRPFPAKGTSQTRGKFEVHGEGSWTKVDLPPAVRDTVARLIPSTPIVARVLPPTEATTGLPPLTCIGTGLGQRAFIAGLESMGFLVASANQAEAALRSGRKVLFHGWGAQYATWGKKYPGQVFTLWHSGLTGSDLMGEGFVLAEALRAAQQKLVTLLWLDHRDVLPPEAILVKPVWSPKDMVALAGGATTKVARRVVVGFHGSYPSAAKNSVAAIAACAGLKADIHLHQGALEGARGAAVRALLVGENHTIHPVMPRAQVAELLASAQVLVHTSLSDTWPYMVMEAIYCGTPVVITDVIAWASLLPQWAQDLCLVRPATASGEIRRLVTFLLDHPVVAQRLVQAQRGVLDSLALSHQEDTVKVLREVGLMSPPKPVAVPRSFTRPKVLLLSDVRGWAFDINLRDMAEYLKDHFDFSFWYVAENKPWPSQPMDLVYLPYLRWPGVNPLVDYRKALGSLRTRYFWPEAPNVPDTTEFNLVNTFRGFHVVTTDNLAELAANCPNTVYLTNPVNMRRFPTATPRRGDVVCSWNGNAKHINSAGVDVKGFYSLVQPACAAAGVPLVYAEYHTKRVPPAEMPAFYQQANLAVSVSLYEGASNSVMEAMASGLALITTDVGNHREMRDSQLKHLGDTGIILVDRDLRSITDAIHTLKVDPLRVHTMGKLNRKEIDARWSWAAWATRYTDFFRRAL